MIQNGAVFDGRIIKRQLDFLCVLRGMKGASSCLLVLAITFYGRL